MNLANAAANVAIALGGMIALAKACDKLIESRMPKVSENPDDVGYFLDGPQGTGPAVALRSLPDDDLPTCPDFIPEWMMPNARP
jgi:hypothetical protein